MPNINDIPNNKGKIVNIGGKDAAVFNDNGAIKAFYTKCPHAECHVQWNNTENTWDCPCHGSKFEKDGALKKGPSTRGLYPMDVKIDGDEITR